MFQEVWFFGCVLIEDLLSIKVSWGFIPGVPLIVEGQKHVKLIAKHLITN